jgi:hypothetical protein
MKIVCSLVPNKALATVKESVPYKARVVSVSWPANARLITSCATVLPLLANTLLICKQKRLCMIRSTDSKTKVLHKVFKIRLSNQSIYYYS